MTVWRAPDPLPSSVYRRMLAVCDDLAAAALQGVGPEALTTVFARALGRQAALLDPELRLLARAGEGGDVPLDWSTGGERLATVLREAQRPLRLPSLPGWPLQAGCLVAPVAVRGQALGYLLVLGDAADPEPDDAEFQALTYAASLFALTLANERSRAEFELRHEQATVDALVGAQYRDRDDAVARARSLGLADAVTFRVAVLRLGWSGRATDHVAEAQTLAATVRSAVPGAVASVHEATVVALIPDDAEARSTREELPLGTALSALWEAWPAGRRPTAGLSELLDHPDAAAEGLRQAQLAVELAGRLGRSGHTVGHHQLGIYRLLFTVADSRRLLGFAREVLGPLLDHGRRSSVDLVHTLSVYLQTHGSRKQTARALGLHPNTVANRAQRIQALTGLDLSDPDDRLLAHVAVKIVESNRPPSG